MSTYPIFNNKDNKTLVFYACAKNANTSAKLFFAKHLGIENNFYFIEDDIPRYKTRESLNLAKENVGKKNLINIWPNYQKFSGVKADIKCCIIRHPYDRFVSTYRNRILFHKDKNFRNYTIDMVLDQLENNKFENKHFLPQYFFLGNTLLYYTFYADMKNIKFFENSVNSFFGKKIEFPKLQTGGKNYMVNLTNKQKKRIQNIYQKDFEFFYI